MKIIAVDDEPMVLEILQAILLDLGHSDFTGFSDPAEAARTLEQQSVDCILLDVQMPEINGLDLARRILGIDRHKDTPIVMLTSQGERATIDASFAEGAMDYIPKPLNRDVIGARLATIKAVLEQRNHEKQLLEAEAVRRRRDFRVPRYFKGVAQMRGYIAFQNYITTLSNKRLMTFSFAAMHVTNARAQFDDFSAQTYEPWIAQVAEALAQALEAQQCVFAHAGGGAFIVAYNRFSDFDEKSIVAKARLALAENGVCYDRDGIPMPRLVAEDSTTATIFSASKPEKLLSRLIAMTAKVPAPVASRDTSGVSVTA